MKNAAFIIQYEGGSCLPRHDFIHERLLLTGSAPEIDAGCLDAFVPHQVSQERDVIILLKKVFGIAMPEGVRIDNLGVKPVLLCVVLQLLGNAAGSDALPVTIQK